MSAVAATSACSAAPLFASADTSATRAARARRGALAAASEQLAATARPAATTRGEKLLQTRATRAWQAAAAAHPKDHMLEFVANSTASRLEHPTGDPNTMAVA